MSTKRSRYGDPRNRVPLVGDARRMVQPSGVADPRRLGGSITGPGGAHDRNVVLIDTTDCVLVGAVEVTVMENVRAGQLVGSVLFMTVDGRVSRTTDEMRVGLMLNTDGAAAIISELLALADRAGPDLLNDLTRRLTALYRDKTIDLAWLRAAIDEAITLAGELREEGIG